MATLVKRKQTERKERLTKKELAKMTQRLDYALIFMIVWSESKKRMVVRARVFYYLTLFYKVSYNNVFFVASTTDRQPLFMLSSGLVGYKHSKKTSDLALRAGMQLFFEKIRLLGFVAVHLYLNAHGSKLFLFIKELKKFLKEQPYCLLLWVDLPSSLPLNGTKRPRRVL